MEKVQHGKVQHGNCRGVVRTPRISKMEYFAAMFNGFGNYCCKSLHLRCLWGSWLHFWKWCKMNKVQQENMWRVQREKKCNMKTLRHKNVQWCSMKNVQLENRAKLRNMNCYSEVREKCTRIWHG